MKQYDVAVVGGGPSGIAAALAAAHCGVQTLLLEKNGYVGGMSTAGLLNLWCGNIQGGLYQKIRSATVEKRKRRWVYSPERLKSYYLELLEEAGVTLLLHSTFYQANRSGSRIDSISALCGGSQETVTASVIIDSTGDGLVAKSAGVPYSKGRESDHLMQPMSLLFTVGGVDDSRAVYPTFGTNPELEEKMKEYLEQGKIDRPAGHVILIEGFDPGTASVNMTNVIRVDGTSARDLTKAELLTRRQVPQIMQFLRDCVPGYENCYLQQTANTIGVRETLHFEGDYTLTEQDIQNQVIFEDWIVSNASACFGNHSLTGSGSDVNNLPYHQERYTIPYRSFLPKGIDNLLLNGRNISGTHMAHSSYRVMPICMGMGEGAGVCAAFSAKGNIPLRSIPIKEVQAALMERFGVLPPQQNQEIL